MQLDEARGNGNQQDQVGDGVQAGSSRTGDSQPPGEAAVEVVGGPGREQAGPDKAVLAGDGSGPEQRREGKAKG